MTQATAEDKKVLTPEEEYLAGFNAPEAGSKDQAKKDESEGGKKTGDEGEKKAEGAKEGHKSDDEKKAAEDAEKELQRKRSLDGILRSEKRRTAEAEARSADLERRLKELEAKSTDSQAARDAKKEAQEKAIVDVLLEDPEVVALGKEYGPEFTAVIGKFARRLNEESDRKTGDLSKTMEEKFSKMADEFKARMSELEPLKKSDEDRKTEEHFSAVSAAHPDYEQYLDVLDDEGNVTEQGALNKWIEASPMSAFWRQIAYRTPTNKGGTAAEVNYMLDQFKRETGITASADAEAERAAVKARKEKDLSDMDTGRGRKNPVGDGSGKAEKTYEQGFKDG